MFPLRIERRNLARSGPLCIILAVAGCAQEMEDQPRTDPQEAAPLFEDHVATRSWPEHVVPAGTSVIRGGNTKTPPRGNEEGYLTGRRDGALLKRPPKSLLNRRSFVRMLERGRSRFNISCVPCHDRIGSGNGMVPRRGFPYPPSYHSERLRNKPLGYFFAVISQGHGNMPAYKNLIAIDDRWAIATYIRALQLSQYAPAAFLKDVDTRRLEAE